MLLIEHRSLGICALDILVAVFDFSASFFVSPFVLKRGLSRGS